MDEYFFVGVYILQVYPYDWFLVFLGTHRFPGHYFESLKVWDKYDP